MPRKREYLREQDYHIFQEMFEWNVYQVFEEDIKGKCVLDVGGHFGMFSLLAHDLGAKQIIAIEANPVNFVNYVKNTKEINNVKVINAACTNITGDILTISIDGVRSQINKGNTNVSTVSLTDALEWFPNNEDIVLKMDIEGAEHLVLPGTSPTLLKDRVSTIVIEIHSEEISGEGNTIEKLKNYIVSIGYDIAWVGGFYTNTETGKDPNMLIAIYKFIRNKA